jgi:hypothetical protein
MMTICPFMDRSSRLAMASMSEYRSAGRLTLRLMFLGVMVVQLYMTFVTFGAVIFGVVLVYGSVRVNSDHELRSFFMKVSGRFIVTDVFESDKGKTYYTAVDLENGGTFKFAVDGKLEKVVASNMVGIDAEFKGRPFGRDVSFSYVQGTISAPKPVA